MIAPLTISQLHDELTSGKYSLTEMLEFYFARIQANAGLNAFITITESYAYKRAKSLQRVIADNPNALEEFPLLGVPIAMKDLFLTEGIRTTAASKVLEHYVPAYSSTVFERLEAAGAILVGKTNCDAWAHGASGENSDFGPTKNPWNTNYVPGGSSSGSAVSVAGAMSLIAMGTDTGGSIRQPASFCGVVGFKPTYGAVSRYGVVAMASSLDCMGHFTRSVADAEAVFKVTRGTDGKDSTVSGKKYSQENKSPAKAMKIGLPKEYFSDGVDPEVSGKIKEALSLLEKEGHKLVEINLPHTEYAVSVYYIVQPAEVSSNLGRYDAVRYGSARQNFGAEAKRRIMLGTYVLSSGYYDAYYLKAMKARTLICKDFANAFEKVEVIVAPVSPGPAFKLGEKSEDPLAMYLSDIFTIPANLAGIPGMSIPVGFTSAGLPIGMQIMAPQFQEDTIFVLGETYQKLTNWHMQTPC